MSITVKGVHKRFGNFVALGGVDLDVRDGELLALLGPSGSGKTTLLRVIAGLETPDAGEVHMDGRDVTDAPPGARKVGFVFQHYALFRHMTVHENVAFGLKIRPRAERPAPAEIKRRVTELLGLVGLDWAASRLPAQLSGGQRQRVALARALAVEPRVLLLDEPFGALDANVRAELRVWLRDLHDELHLTSVFVTHDQEEAMEIAHRVAVFRAGGLEQVGSPEEVYDAPASEFVFRFLGRANELGGELVRPHDLHVAGAPAAGFSRGTLLRARRLGGTARLDVRADGDGGNDLEIEVPASQLEALNLSPGAPVYFRAERARSFGEG